MGFRSEVEIATTQSGYDMICKYVDELSAIREDYSLMGKDRQPEFFEKRNGLSLRLRLDQVVRKDVA